MGERAAGKPKLAFVWPTIKLLSLLQRTLDLRLPLSALARYYPSNTQGKMAERSMACDSSESLPVQQVSHLRKGAWVRIPLLSTFFADDFSYGERRFPTHRTKALIAIRPHPIIEAAMGLLDETKDVHPAYFIPHPSFPNISDSPTIPQYIYLKILLQYKWTRRICAGLDVPNYKKWPRYAVFDISGKCKLNKNRTIT